MVFKVDHKQMPLTRRQTPWGSLMISTVTQSSSWWEPVCSAVFWLCGGSRAMLDRTSDGLLLSLDTAFLDNLRADGQHGAQVANTVAASSTLVNGNLLPYLHFPGTWLPSSSVWAPMCLHFEPATAPTTLLTDAPWECTLSRTERPRMVDIQKKFQKISSKN